MEGSIFNSAGIAENILKLLSSVVITESRVQPMDDIEIFYREARPPNGALFD